MSYEVQGLTKLECYLTVGLFRDFNIPNSYCEEALNSLGHFFFF